MKFSIDQIKLLEGLQKISGVVPIRSTTPVLENILFDLEGSNLMITGTDLEVSVSTKISTKKTEKPGAIALPAKVITEMIRSLPDILINFELDENNRMKITTEQGLYQVAGISKENFPEMPELPEENTFEIKNSILHRMFSKTIFAVSSDELRPALMGVFIQILADELRMVATDGHRLSKIVNKNFRCDESAVRVIIPPKAVQIALRNLEDDSSTKLTINESGVYFEFGSTTLYTRLVEGDYPDYERVIPRDNDIELIVNKNLLTDSVRRVSLFSSALTHQVRFSLSPNKLVVFSEDLDIGGEAREEIEVNYSRESMEIGYNAQYLLDILKHVDTDEIMFNLKSPIHAALIVSTEKKEEETFIMLIMPIKLSA